VKAGDENCDQGQTEITAACGSAISSYSNCSGSGLADRRSRRTQRQSRPHPVPRRNATDRQRTVDRRVILAVSLILTSLRSVRVQCEHSCDAAIRLMSHPTSIKGVLLVDGRVLLVKNPRCEWELPGGDLNREKITPKRYRANLQRNSPSGCSRPANRLASFRSDSGASRPHNHVWLYVICVNSIRG